ncbi:hypothetical protein [Streptomyces vinaceus]|uniref:hypothetical protein n=1 Tax=Streptomyces vinaceus TaxID=1960 RepID=UPI0037FC3EC4
MPVPQGGTAVFRRRGPVPVPYGDHERNPGPRMGQPPAAALLATSGAVVAAGAGAVFLARRRRAAQI